MSNPFIHFGLVLIVVFLVSILMRILKQPLIIGYILSGIILGPYFLNLVQESETILIFSEMGIAFLLFIVGLHLSPKVIKEVGKISVITGIGQIIFTSFIGFFVARLFGFNLITSLYIAIGLTFSSTIIIMKLISDKDALEKLYGKISVGFLLVQDFVAILILILVSSMANGESNPLQTFFFTLIKGFIVVAILGPVSYYLLPKFSHFLSKSQEFLFLFSITWGFGLSMLFLYFGFSIEVGALLAGVILSMSPYSHEIGSKLKPLRDFFIISFFIILGSQMVFGNFSQYIFPTLIFALLIVIGNPLIVMILMGYMKYSKKTSFMAGLTVAQIGEFSLIFIALGVKVGHISKEILSFMTLISLVTIFGCTYLIMYSDQIYEKLSGILKIFERKTIKEKEIPRKNYKYILIGQNRIGFSVIRSFSKLSKDFMVLDYNPQIVKDLNYRGIKAIYGDAEDADFLEEVRIFKASLIVSTIPDKETNQIILDVLKRNNSKAIKILTARQIEDAIELYNSGADYVILPHFLGGEYVARMILEEKSDIRKYLIEKEKHLKLLKEIRKKGMNHPKIDRN